MSKYMLLKPATRVESWVEDGVEYFNPQYRQCFIWMDIKSDSIGWGSSSLGSRVFRVNLDDALRDVSEFLSQYKKKAKRRYTTCQQEEKP